MPPSRNAASADGSRRADGRRTRGFSPLGWTVIVLVGLVILAGVILLISLVASSTSSSPTPTRPSDSRSCSGTTWFDASTGTCVPRAVCASGETYEAITNTCSPAPVAAPVVDGIEPVSGLVTGGTEVRITGSGFKPDVSVTIDGVPAVGVTLVSDTAITAKTPASKSLYPVDVVVTNPDGASVTLDNAFLYVALPVDRITEIVPTKGSKAGGEPVIIKGVDFVDGMIVTFDARAATDVTVLNAKTLRVTTPQGRNGAVTVTVRNPDGDPYAKAKAFTYTDQAPRVVAAVRPKQGAAAGGTKVTISGSGFAKGAVVSFAGKSATKVVVVSSTRITAITPAGVVGPVIVGVRNPGLPAAFLADGFTYVEAPTVTGVAPAEGPVTGGTKVKVTGTGFLPKATITVNGKPATAVKVVGDTTITATTPAGVVGPATIVVTNPGQPAATAKKAFTYTAAPTPVPTATRATCPSYQLPDASAAAGSGIGFGASALFPTSLKISAPVIGGATIKSGGPADPGTITWNDTPPRIVWTAGATGGRGTITFVYGAGSCSGTGTVTIPVLTN